jgi:hypothetical protein
MCLRMRVIVDVGMCFQNDRPFDITKTIRMDRRCITYVASGVPNQVGGDRHDERDTR